MEQKNIEIKGLGNLEKKFGEVCQQIEIFEELKAVLRTQILDAFEQNFGHTGVTWINPETNCGLQRIIQVRTNIDTEGVKKALPKQIWDIIKKEEVDRKKFDAAIRIGTIKPETVKDAIETKEIDKLDWKPAK